MHIPVQVVAPVAGASRRARTTVRQSASGHRSRLAFWFGAALLITVFLTRAAVAGAQGTEASRLWQPAKVVKAEPKKAEPKQAEPKLAATKAPAKVAEPAKAAPAVDSSAVALQQRLDELERATREQSAVIMALQARLDSATPVPTDTVTASAVADSVVPAGDSVVTSDSVASTPAVDTTSAAPKVAVDSTSPAGTDSARTAAKAEPAAPSIEEVVKSIEVLSRHLDSLQKEITDVEKRGIQRVSGLGNFRFTGDVRMRYEPTFQGGGTETRHRERTRARFHITGAAGGEFTGGLSIATGADNEPQTENQTHTGFFTRKTMAFERFFINYKPKAVPGLSLTAGKFPTPWTRTPLTFSSDLYPEGVAGAYKTPFKSANVEDVSIVGFWLPMLEVSGGPDSYLNGGQVQAKFKFDARTKGAASAAVINAVRADAIATAVAGGTFKPSWPTSNTVRTDSTGKVLGFAQGFRLMDFIVSAERAVSKAWPVAVSLNLVKNALAEDGNDLGYMGEVKVGSTSSGKAQFTVTRYRIERDAVLSAFNVTDIRLGSNSAGYIAAASFKLRSDLTAGFTGYFGQVLDPTKTPSLVAPDFKSACKTAPFSGCRDPLWSRLQFDFIYTF